LEPFALFWRREKYVAPTYIQTACCPTHSVVAMLTTLVWLLGVVMGTKDV